MKKFICILIAAVMLMSYTAVFADSPITIYINGAKLVTDVDPVIVNDRTMVPFRAILETLGADITWSDQLKTVYANLNGVHLTLTIGSATMRKGVEKVTLDAAPFIKDGRTLVPVRAICEAYSCNVEWDAVNKYVIITTQNYTGPKLPEQVTVPEVTTPEVTVPVQPETSGDSGFVQLPDEDSYFEKDSATIIAKAFEAINDYRVENGLSALEYSTELEDIAYSHCCDMAENDYLSHTSPEGVNTTDRLDDAQIDYIKCSELVSMGYATPSKVVQSWIDSEKHRDDILVSGFTKAGISFYDNGNNNIYWSLILIAD